MDVGRKHSSQSNGLESSWMCGCDKTNPFLVMGAASSGHSLLWLVSGGPMLVGRFKGKKIGTVRCLAFCKKILKWEKLSPRRFIRCRSSHVPLSRALCNQWELPPQWLPMVTPFGWLYRKRPTNPSGRFKGEKFLPTCPDAESWKWSQWGSELFQNFNPKSPLKMPIMVNCSFRWIYQFQFYMLTANCKADWSGTWIDRFRIISLRKSQLIAKRAASGKSIGSRSFLWQVGLPAVIERNREAT